MPEEDIGTIPAARVERSRIVDQSAEKRARKRLDDRRLTADRLTQVNLALRCFAAVWFAISSQSSAQSS
jgi:hypothetical protein